MATSGALVSSLTVRVDVVPELPALSVAKYDTTWVPSPATVTVAVAAWTVLCCPSSTQEVRDSTPLPPASSVALRATVTGLVLL